MIIHLFGTQCCGKTYCLREFSINPKVAIFDVQDFYRKHGCINKAEEMDWDKFREAINYIEEEFNLFLDENKDKLKIVETSGTNRNLNNILNDLETIDIRLQTPDIGTLTIYASEKGISEKNAYDFYSHYQKRMKFIKIPGFSLRAAKIIIRSYLKEPKLSYSLPEELMAANIPKVIPSSNLNYSETENNWNIDENPPGNIISETNYKEELWKSIQYNRIPVMTDLFILLELSQVAPLIISSINKNKAEILIDCIKWLNKNIYKVFYNFYSFEKDED